MLTTFPRLMLDHARQRPDAAALREKEYGIWQTTSWSKLASLVRDGRLVSLGVTSLKRSTVYADIPTLAESGLPGFEFESWGGMVAPAKTPRPIITRLNREIATALGAPDTQQRMRALGAEPVSTSPEAYDLRIASEIAKIGTIARRAGITPQ